MSDDADWNKKITFEEAADRLGISVDAVRRGTKNSQTLPMCRMEDGRTGVYAANVERLAAQGWQGRAGDVWVEGSRIVYLGLVPVEDEEALTNELSDLCDVDGRFETIEEFFLETLKAAGYVCWSGQPGEVRYVASSDDGRSAILVDSLVSFAAMAAVIRHLRLQSDPEGPLERFHDAYEVSIVDLDCDLNMEDDEGRNWTLLRNAKVPVLVVPGAVLRAGRPRFWSWVRVLAIDDDGQVHFERIDGPGA